MKQANLAGVQR